MGAPKFIARTDQRFACRDCPARCCRVPWSIRFSEEETARYVAEPWIHARLSAEAMDVLESGVLPMREHDRRLQCVFLDDDMLCSLHKKFGHSYIPRSCQSFPFGFVTGENNEVIAQLSNLCPSIRDNYGEPVGPMLEAKLEQSGKAERISTAMSTMGNVILSRSQYLGIVASWETHLREKDSPAAILATLYDRMLAFEEALGSDSERVEDTAVDAAMKSALAKEVEALEPHDKPSFHARALYSYTLGNLCYPSRVRQPHAVNGKAAFQRTRSLANKTAWMRNRGRVDLLFVPAPFKLQQVSGVAPFLAGEHGAIVRDYLLATLERRGVFSTPRYLLDVLIDLCMAAAVISRFARCSALASDRDEVNAADVNEGISVCELVLSNHVSVAEEGMTITNLRRLLLSDRVKLRKLLASEA